MKTGRIHCVYLAPQQALQVLAVVLYQEKEKQHGRVGNMALPGLCLFWKELL